MTPSGTGHASDLYVFGYGSLVSAASVGATLGHDLGPGDGPFRATLSGWRTAWNVGSDTGSHPDREFRDPAGAVYDGVVAVLGIEPRPGATCRGAVFAVGADALPRLDRRERNYERRDVTGRVRWPGRPARCRVVTYVPRPGALRRLVDARAAGREVVVRRSYLALVRAAFGADPVPDPPFRLRDLTQHVRLAADRRRDGGRPGNFPTGAAAASMC